MYEYDDEVLDTFLKKQTQLFSEEVADTPEAAEEFLEDCMAVVCKNIKEVRDYFDEAGSDISGMSDDELMDQSEAFDTLLFSLSVSVIFFCFAIETMQYMRVSSSTVTSLIYFSTFDASSVSSRFTSYIVPYRFL